MKIVPCYAMGLFIILLLIIAVFMLGVVVGLTYGFSAGVECYDRFKFWQCTCNREDRCLFFGTEEQALQATSRCFKSSHNVSVLPKIISMDCLIRDVSDT